MWSSINDMASEALSGCNMRLELVKDKVTKIMDDHKENMSVLASISLVDHPRSSDVSLLPDDKAKMTTKSELYEDTAEKYDTVIKLTKENIEYGIGRLDEIERTMRLEKAKSFLFEGGKMCKEVIFHFHSRDNGRKGVCFRLGGVYTTAFATGEDRKSLSFIERSYPLVAEPATFITGIELASDKNNHDADLIVEHLNYAVMEQGKFKVYQDEIKETNHLFEANLSTDRLSRIDICDLKEHSKVFDVQVISNEDFRSTLSITIDNGPAVYESRPLFEYKGDTSAKGAASIDEDGDEEDEKLDELSRHRPTYYTPSDDMATRAADYMMSETFNYTRELHKILVETRKNTSKLVPLKIKHASSKVLAAAATNPLLDGMADCVNDDKRIAILYMESDIQDSITRSVASLKPKRLNGYNALLKLIDDNFTDEFDLVVSKQLLEEEEYASRLAIHITKDLFESLKFLGGLGLDASVLQQREAIEGMRSEQGYWCGGRMRHCNTDCLKREQLAEAIKDWICTGYGSTLSQTDSRTIKTKYFSSIVQQCKKRNRPSSDNDRNRKRCKNDDGSPSNVAIIIKEEEKNYKETTHKIQVGTIMPPVMISEPREASSGNVMSEIIGEYASLIAKYVAESPYGSVRLASTIKLLLSFKRRLITNITRPSDNIMLIQPVELPQTNDGSSSPAASSLCEALFARSENMFSERDTTEDAGIARLLEKARLKLDLEDEEKKKLAGRMKGLLNMRRCCEERAAYRHLVSVLILEKIVGILSGEGTVYSLHLRNAANWYTKVAIRNRVCDLIDVMSPENTKFVPELIQQVLCSLKWFLNFDINHKYLLQRNIISATAFQSIQVSSPHSFYSPGTRHTLLVDLQSGVEALPVVATRLPPMTSMIRQVHIGDSLSLSVNNYNTGNLFVFSCNGMKTRHRERKMTGDDMHSMLHLSPFNQLKKDELQSPTLRSIVQHWDDYELEHATDNTYLKRVVQQKRDGSAEEVIRNGTATTTIFVCNYKTIWKNLHLLEPSQYIGYRFAINSKARTMLSLSEQYALNNTLEGRSLLGYKKAVEKYISSCDNEKKRSLTKIDLLAFSTENGEELCRCEGLNDCMFRHKNDTIKSVVDLYEAKTMRNKEKLKRYIATGNTSAPSDDKKTTVGGGGGTKEGGATTAALSTDAVAAAQCAEVTLGKNPETDDEGEKRVGSVGKAPASFNGVTVTSTDMISFMSKMYNVIKVNQKLREKCILKKMGL